MGALWGTFSALGIGLSELFSRRVVVGAGALTAAFVMQSIAVSTSVLMVFFFASEITLVDSMWGALSGVGMVVGLASYLEGLRRSSSSVVAPTTATLSALLPFVYTIVRGENVSTFAIAGAFVALVGLSIIASGSGSLSRGASFRGMPLPRRRPRAETVNDTAPVGFMWGTVSGIGYGFAIAVLLEVSDEAGVWPAVPQRFTSAVLLGVVCAISRQAFAPPTGYRLSGAMAGVVGGFSSVFILIGLAVDAAPAVIMQSMFPAVSVVVGFLVFGDRVTRRQLLGLGLVLLGSAALVA